MAVGLDYPFTGRWLVQNSPADRVPSHGTALFASAHAIDFVPVDDRGRSAPFRFASLARADPPDRFPGFGRTILAPADGIVVAVHDGAPDHAAYRGMPSIGYALSQRRRAAAGWTALSGNVVLIDVGGVVVALCHLQRGSVTVSIGQQLGSGEVVGRCGNSGNSTEPHVHVQAMDGVDPRTSTPVPMLFRGVLPRSGDVVAA